MAANMLTGQPAAPGPMAASAPSAPTPTLGPIDGAPEVSPRVPVPAQHFDPTEHAGLHEMMGPDFDDNPIAQHFVRVGYHAGHRRHQGIEPKHMLEAARDAYHAFNHGFMPLRMALDAVGMHARNQQAAASARKDAKR